MSRGPGRWQRALIAAVERHDLVPVATIAYNVLGRDPTRSEMVAVRRAARRLVEDGRARAIYLGSCLRCGELSPRWDCTSCRPRSGCNRVLVLTPRTGIGAEIDSARLSRYPDYVSVATESVAPVATLSGGGAT